MSVAPVQRPVAACKDTVPIAGLQRPASGRRDRPSGVVELVLELAAPGEPGERGVTGVALHRRRRHGAAALNFARRRPRPPAQRVHASPDNQLRPRARAIPLATGTLAAEFDQGIMLPLPVAAFVIFDWLHEGLQRRPYRGAALSIEQAVAPDKAILPLPPAH